MDATGISSAQRTAAETARRLPGAPVTVTACFGYRRALTHGRPFSEWGFIEPPEYFSSTAAAVRAAFRR